jgi:hypothetical protein
MKLHLHALKLTVMTTGQGFQKYKCAYLQEPHLVKYYYTNKWFGLLWPNTVYLQM